MGNRNNQKLTVDYVCRYEMYPIVRELFFKANPHLRGVPVSQNVIVKASFLEIMDKQQRKKFIGDES